VAQLLPVALAIRPSGNDMPITSDELPLVNVATGLPLMPDPAPPAAPQSPIQQQPGPAASALQDPSFAAFVKQRAGELGLLKDAQTQAAKDRKWADVGNDFVRAGDTAMGKQSDEAALQAKLDATQRPVANLLQQQQYSQEATKGAGADADLASKLQQRAVTVAMMDPNSDLSKRAQMLAVAKGLISPRDAAQLSADQYDSLLKGATFEESKRDHDLRLELEARKENAANLHQDKQLGLQRSELSERTRHDRADELFASGKLSQKTLPPAESQELQAYGDAADAIDQLKAQQQAAGPVGGFFGVGEGGKYNQMKNALADAVAKAESRGRTNPAAAAKLAAQLPGAGTRDSQASAYFDSKRGELVKSMENRLKELEASGIAKGELGQFQQQLARLKGSGGASAQASGGPVKIVSDADYDQLPKGAQYIAPDGSARVKQ
jgi:hypothetical protein